MDGDVNPAGSPACLPQSLFGDALALRDEVEEIDCHNTVFLGFNATNFTPIAPPYPYLTEQITELFNHSGFSVIQRIGVFANSRKSLMCQLQQSQTISLTLSRRV